MNNPAPQVIDPGPALIESPDRTPSRCLRAYDPRQNIFREGDSGDVMYVVEAGAVMIRKEDAKDPIQLTTLGKGEFFGEVALVDHSPRTASAIDRADFVYLVSQQPAVALVVLEVTASRLRFNSHH